MRNHRNTLTQYSISPLAKAVMSIGLTTLISTGHVNAASGFQLEEVVVTARKVEENLQDAPLAVSAFTGEGLEQRGFADISAIAQSTPNLVFDTSPPISGNSAGAAVFLRGVGQLDFTVNVDPGVGVYVDGVYMSRSVGSVVDLIDVERLEILRGPQGTLFGRNTIGGAVQLFSKQPSEEFGGFASMTLGSDSRTDFQLSMDVPLTDNLLSKFSVLSRQRDGYVTDGRGVELGDDDSLSARAQFELRSTDNLTIALALDATRDRENGTANVATELFPGSVPNTRSGADGMPTRYNNLFAIPSTSCTEDTLTTDRGCFGPQWETGSTTRTESTFPLTKTDNDILGGALTLTYDMDWATFKSITAVRSLESEFGRDSDHSPYPIFATANVQEHDQFSQEFQITGESENLRWVAGLYYFEEEADELTQIYLPAFGGPVVLNGVFDNHVENKSTALYGELTYDFSDAWSLTVGLRGTDETKEYVSDQGFVVLGLLSDPNVESNASYKVDVNPNDFVVTLVDEPGAEVDYTETTTRMTLAYHPNEDLMLYGTYADGFKSGGFNPRYLAPAPDLRAVAFDPEYVDMLEFGVKYTSPDNTLRINAAAFINDYDDIQISTNPDFTGGATITQNAAKAQITGLEMEFTYVPSDALLIEGGFGYLNAEYDELSEDVSFSPDNELARVPEFTGNLGLSYRYVLSQGGTITPRLDLTYRSETEGTAENDPQAHEDAYSLLNISAAYQPEGENWLLTLGVSNATDEEYFNSVNVNQRLGYAEAAYARGREYYLSAKYKF